jgi:cytochrome P450
MKQGEHGGKLNILTANQLPQCAPISWQKMFYLARCVFLPCSAASIAFLLLELAKNPTEQYRLQKELREMKEAERKDSEQLKNCIREAMRLWPVSAPGPFRQVGRDYIVKSSDPSEKDIMIPKGSLVFMPIICLFRNESVFDDHQRFVPSRWDCPTEEMKKAWMPFAVGSRNCLGQSLATCEMQTILSRLCTNYNLKWWKRGHWTFFLSYTPSVFD